MKKIIFLLLAVFVSEILFAKDDFLNAQTLFHNQKYSSAQAVINKLFSSGYVTEEIMYLNAKCSKQLFLTDAISLYNNLNETFPYHKFKNEVYYDMAIIYYREKKYKEAVSSFLKVKSLSDEGLFKLAYSYFSIDSLVEAQLYFSKIMNTEIKFAAPSKYYYAYIAYDREMYNSALDNFIELLDDDKFGSIVPYYISQIYFHQKKYEQLIKFAKPLSENVISSRKSEINRLLAEAYYQTSDFENAAYHFEIFLSEEKDVSSLVYFLLGNSYYKIENYKNAISNFERVSSAVDSVMQYSSYYLASSYLKVDNYSYALQAFKKSASYNYNVKLQEEAYFSYAKLSFQLDLPFENTIGVLSEYLERFNHPMHTKEIETLMVKILQSTSQYFDAYSVLKNIISPSFDQKIALQQLCFFLGVKEFNNQDFKEALSYFSCANDYPINASYLYLSNFWIADCYYRLSDYDRAIEGYNQLVFVSEDDDLVYYNNLKKYNLAYAYFQSRDYVSALKWFRSFEKVAYDKMMIHDTYLRIADCYFMSSDFSLSAKYYEKAISLNAFDIDYALYQNSVSIGLVGNNASKVKLLKQIIAEFPNSSYYDNAIYDLAKYYTNISNFDLAEKYYDELIISSKNIDLIADAYLSKGMIYFNSGKIESAITEFLFVLNNYQKTKYFKEALAALKSSYSSIAKIDEYLTIIESLPEISITKSEQDSLTYNAAFMKFSEMDYDVAKNAFDKYLQNFVNGIFIHDAYYYSAISSLKTGDTINAINNYEKVVNSGAFEYQEKALMFLARKSYNMGDYDRSNLFYTKLLDFASSNSLKRETVIRLMNGYEYIDKLISLKYAKQVIEFEKIDDWLMSKAYIIIARSEFESGNYAKSKLTFEKVSTLSFYDEGAEAKYYLAYLTYLDDNLALAEELIFALADDYHNDHFIAKAFILLSDIYVAQGNIFQAKATLESIIDNHDDEDLINIARKKWELMLEKEKEIVFEEVQEEVFIEILEDDFQYEVQEIDEDYVVPIPDTLKIKRMDGTIGNKNIMEYEFE